MSQRQSTQRPEMQQNATPGNNIHAAALMASLIRSRRKKLSERQKTAIELLLQGLSDQEAAAQIGVDRSTIFRWRRRPRFAAALEAQRQLRRERAVNQLQSMVPAALKILQQQLDSADGRERLRAVSILLRFATPGRLATTTTVAAPTAAANPAHAETEPQVDDDLLGYLESPLPGEPGAPGMPDDAEGGDDAIDEP